MRAWLSLGGNLGRPDIVMADALRRLDGTAGSVRTVSRLYRTPPWGRTDQPDFLNCCALVETALNPETLLARCLETERALDRVRDERWGPRTIDIDIIDVEGVWRRSETLTLPHPQAHQRAFVLVPLLEIDPAAMLQGRPAAEWLAELDAADIRPASLDGGWWRESGRVATG